MGLRCSLIGHDFGEPDVEREREERGSEVVVTLREYEECSRCGEKHVISETTEVTSLTAEASSDTGRSPEGPVEPAGADRTEEKPTEAEVLGDAPTGTGETADSPDLEDPEGLEDDVAGVEDDAEVLEDETEILEDDVEVIEDDVTGVEDDAEVLEDNGFEDSTTTDPAEPTEPADPEVPGDGTGEPVTDDAEILEEEATPRTDRQHGEWPDASDVGPPVGGDERSAVWPDSDEGTTTAASESETGTSSGVFVDAEAEDEGIEEPVPETESDDPETGIASAQSVPAPGSSDRRDDAVMEYFCPRCEFVAPGNRGSLRAGDICPECRKGYLGERKR